MHRLLRFVFDVHAHTCSLMSHVFHVRCSVLMRCILLGVLGRLLMLLVRLARHVFCFMPLSGDLGSRFMGVACPSFCPDNIIQSSACLGSLVILSDAVCTKVVGTVPGLCSCYVSFGMSPLQ